MEKTLDGRIQDLEDIEKIKQLQYRYVNDLTTNNMDDLINCFVEDSATDFPYPDHGRTVGKAAIEKDFRERISHEFEGKSGNFVVHPIITVDGNKAKANWLLYIQCEGGTKSVYQETPDWIRGFYDMEYVKENGIWKIKVLKWVKRVVSYRSQQAKNESASGS